MIKKPLPTEVIVGLYHQLVNLSAKHPDRKLLVQEASKIFDVSLSTVRRALKNYHSPRSTGRSDYNQPRKISREEMLRYCELIAALKIRSTNRNNKQKQFYSGKKRRHSLKTQVVVDKKTKQVICTAFANGKRHDFNASLG